jgi:hypothetical protein
MTIKGSLTVKLKGIKSAINQTRQETLAFAKSITPIRSGNARNHTTLEGNQIKSSYPYAHAILMEGHSPQLKAGEYVPRVKAFMAKRIAANLKSRGFK